MVFPGTWLFMKFVSGPGLTSAALGQVCGALFFSSLFYCCVSCSDFFHTPLCAFWGRLNSCLSCGCHPFLPPQVHASFCSLLLLLHLLDSLFPLPFCLGDAIRQPPVSGSHGKGTFGQQQNVVLFLALRFGVVSITWSPSELASANLCPGL